MIQLALCEYFEYFSEGTVYKEGTMTGLVPYNSGYLSPKIGVSGYLGDITEHRDTIIDTFKNISDTGEDTYRGDLISDVNKGLGIVATGIKIISAILTILGGTTNRR